MRCFEEVTFDESRITTARLASYPILTMADIPEIKVVLLTPEGRHLRRRVGSSQCAGGASDRSGISRCNGEGYATASSETRLRAGSVEDVAVGPAGLTRACPWVTNLTKAAAHLSMM